MNTQERTCPPELTHMALHFAELCRTGKSLCPIEFIVAPDTYFSCPLTDIHCNAVTMEDWLTSLMRSYNHGMEEVESDE